MFPLVVVFGNVHRNCGNGRSRGLVSEAKQHAAEREARDVFEHVGVLDGVGYGFSPGKRGMAGDQNAGYGNGVEVLQPEAADDDRAGIADVGFGDFFGGQRFSDRNGTVEVVCVGGAEARDGPPSLCP